MVPTENRRYNHHLTEGKARVVRYRVLEWHGHYREAIAAESCSNSNFMRGACVGSGLRCIGWRLQNQLRWRRCKGWLFPRRETREAERLRCLADETAVLLPYTLVHGNTDILEYNKLAEQIGGKKGKGGSIEHDTPTEDISAELHIYSYTDFLRIVLEILNAVFTYALPRNPEVVYAILHRKDRGVSAI
ncbi:hypothetical protein Tsubulata_012555 [Turnera subulata]|uniref:Dymeclin n=1 Tax=Turnera subulata TaxID=218843 RepID=A0A9Q0JLK9_9ROSI|nr:hypothetical protein Tsubulata_012555 [Turnera subulata]